ncbi:MAG: hypothetical protein ACOC8H_01035 [bacterium]
MTEMNDHRNSTRTEWLVKILARLQDRDVDVTATPLTLETVRAVVTTGDEIINEDLAAQGLGPMPDFGDDSAEVFELLEDCELPAGGLARVEMIIKADEAVAFRHFFETTAESHATTWNEYMNRANARGHLGRFGEAFEDYATAESLAERQPDQQLISDNRQRLLLRVLKEGDGG